jgi:hypothetical protein
MNSQSAVTSAFNSSVSAHLHMEDETCPSCGQEIPPEKLEEINGKIAARERERVLAITTNLEQRFEAEKVQANTKAKAELELAQQESAALVAAAREETQQAADVLMNQKLLAAKEASQQQAAELQRNLDEVAAARNAAEALKEGLQAQLLQTQQEGATAVEAAKAEATKTAEAAAAKKLAEAEIARRESEGALKAQLKEAEAATEAVGAEATKVAEAAAAQKLADAQKAHTESEAVLEARIAEVESSKTAAEEAGVLLSLQVNELTKANEAEVTKLKEEAAIEAARIRKEATETAEAALSEKLAANDKAVAVANAKALEAETRIAALTSEQESTLAQSLESQREILEKDKEAALNAERAKAFEESQKLSTKVNDLQRALEKKTNEELGEGAEIDLYEALKKDFPDDKIDRIKKGSPGADIIHVVLLQGRECGTIIYDSKNHRAFRNDHVTKLKADQLAAKAEHAILSTHKFPQGAGQLHLQDGVVLANPARVVLIATLVRRHLLQVHTLRLSGIERERKTTALYDFITSQRCTQLIERIDGRADELLEMQAKEVRWHENNWKKQGETIRAIQKAKTELENEIGSIVGMTESDERKLVGTATCDELIAEAS